MTGNKKKTNPVLVLIVVMMCILLGAFLNKSSAEYSTGSEGVKPNTIVAEKTKEKTDTAEKNSSEDTEEKLSPAEEEAPEPTVTPTPTPAPTPTPTPAFAASPEASVGVWTPNGSRWMFLVNGTPYYGWLTDLDGKRYYMDPDGNMHVGWLDDGGKRYYMDLDGIMQTGTVTIDDEKYQFLEDGSLKGYEAGENASEEVSPAPEEASDQETPVPEAPAAEQKMVALTFDDGPSSFTNRLLDCLEANNVKATFFLVGTEASYFTEEVKRIASLGCELGNHSNSHTDFTTLDAGSIQNEISKVDELVMELTGQTTTVLRPPYGSYNSTVASLVNLPMILWSIDTLDWETQDAQKIVDAVMSEVKDGSVILMHDLFPETVDAIEILIPRLKEEGYTMMTIHELAAAKGVELQPGTAYRFFGTEEE